MYINILISVTGNPIVNESTPAGIITFMFTDIEGSSHLWEQSPEAMKSALANHDAILRQAVADRRGYMVKTTGDGCLAAFETVADALAAALTAQQALQAETWQWIQPYALRVRIGIHTGEAEQRAGDYFGPVLNRTARLMSVGHGGQILVSAATAALGRDFLPAQTQLVDLGEHRLKDLARKEHIYQLVHPALQSVFPPLKSLDAYPNNLPIQLTSFIGRDQEIAELQGLLDNARLVTLTGPGGTGKTRLSQEVGSEELASFASGVWLIELAPLSDSAQIIPTMAQVFGLQELPSKPLADLVVDYLRDKKILLLLDNCEHLIEACARLTDDLLHQCKGLKILTSSREALGIAGEVAYRMPSLADSESIQLFVDRAHAATPNFNLTEANASAIAQICQRLDGIPLAIELAAARVKVLSPEQIASRLDDRFRLLVGGSRTALPRQQTLRALIDWSYDLLSDEEKRLLQFASVFVGGWTLDALEAVAEDPDTLALLEQLVNKSLVVTEEQVNEMRYSMLETIRQYAREKMFEMRQASAVRDRHFVYFNELSEKMWDDFRLENLLPVVKRATDEVENFRAALEWGLEYNIEENLRLAANYCIVTSLLGIPAEGVASANSAVERASTLPPLSGDADVRRQKLIARALFAQGLVGMALGNMPHVIQVLREAIEISRATGDKQMLGYSLGMYYTATRFISAPDRDEAAQEALFIFNHEVNDSFGLGMAYMGMARLAAERGDENQKEMYINKLKGIIRESPGTFQEGMFHLSLGITESAQGNYAAAIKFLEDGRKIFKGIGSVNFELILRSEIGHIERRTGNLEQANLIYRETIKDWQVLGNRSAIAHQLECFGFIAIADEDPQRAIKLLSAADSLRENTQSQMTDQERIEYGEHFGRLRSMLPDAEFNTIWAEGRSMTIEESIKLAISDD